mmetsp:Transcript_74172/g.140292  ORF Transcript_74172/g.140292 Transcript_74172/m.140292 type:complete len:246 (-) Transcript_74172:790-1527(-)
MLPSMAGMSALARGHKWKCAIWMNSTRGWDSSSMWSSTFHRAPSMNRPCKNAPVSGPFVSAPSSSFGVRTLKSKSVWSMGILNWRAKFCSVPVMKACVKKNPLTQYRLGGFFDSNQLRKKSSRSKKSFTHAPKPFREGYETFPHPTGTLPFTMLLPIASNSPLITTKPFTARWISLRLDATSPMTRLKRISSCTSTVFMHSSYNTGKSSKATSTSYCSGIFPWMSRASSSSVSSHDFPAPPPVCG